MIKWSIKEDIALVITYTPNTQALKYNAIIINIKRESENNIVIVEYVNIPLISLEDHSNKINKTTVVLSGWYNRKVRFNRYLQGIPYRDSRIIILFKCTLSVLQDRSYIRP